MINRTISISAILLYLIMAYAGLALGAVSPDEASKLGASLTAVGAEKAGNADGSIPAYTGGLTTPPREYVKGSGLRPDPFSGERPLFSIDTKNMSQYGDKLTEGVKAMMKKYPSFRLDVYKTHRTVAFPEFVNDATKKNAVAATTAKEGLAIRNAHAGFPFPIPADGYQAIWNHQLRLIAPVSYQTKIESYNIDSSGNPALSLKAEVAAVQPYYDVNDINTAVAFKMRMLYTGPPRRAGEAVVLADPLDYTGESRRAWSYLPGQRRVRRAPDIAFDTPNPGTAGASCYDDTYVFNGSMERYTWKLIGKKAVYIPYNTYALTYYQGDVNKVLTPKHMNPDFIRWELHRVWVVEATLKPGMRHVYAKRTFYLDEDSWYALSAENYDKRGNIYRVTFGFMAPGYEVPTPDATFMAFFDLIARTYAVNMWPRIGGTKFLNKVSDSTFNPEALAGAGLR
jgi:hypothetical protein